MRQGPGPHPRMPVGPDPALADFLPLLPPQGKMYKDHHNNRWRGYYMDNTLSRSWVCRPSIDCANE
eukprot:4231272-Prorocentrum_lima.AAC.1